MRRKPTIIAFKTPSQDDLAVDEAGRAPRGDSQEARMEEGRFEAVAMTEGEAVKYPVGKPLEVSDGADKWPLGTGEGMAAQYRAAAPAVGGAGRSWPAGSAGAPPRRSDGMSSAAYPPATPAADNFSPYGRSAGAASPARQLGGLQTDEQLLTLPANCQRAVNPRPVGLWRPTRPVGEGPFWPPPRYLENHAT